MKKQNFDDILKIVSKFKKRVLEHKPPSKKMYDELRMMKFRIRPLQGDISLLNLKSKEFIEILWSLGKLEEFFQFQFNKIDPPQREVFLRLFDGIHQKYQEELNDLNLRPEKLLDSANMFEMEIFKEKKLKSN